MPTFNEFIQSIDDFGREHWGLLIVAITIFVMVIAVGSLHELVLAYRRLRLVHSRNYKMLKAAATGTRYNMRRPGELAPGIPAWVRNTPLGATDIQSAGRRD